MSSAALDESVRALLDIQLDSFEKLEIVRVLQGSKCGMSPSEIETACRFSSELVKDTLSSLEHAKLVEHDPGNHRVRLGIAANDPRFATLMQLYDEDRPGVLGVLSSAVVQRLRGMAARAFADAFVIRKKRDGDG